MRYITAITMGPGTSEQHITRCQYLNATDGKQYFASPKWIAEKIRENSSVWQFRVAGKDGPSDVVAMVPTDGRDPYIRTKADGAYDNNLLALPFIR